jgi:hypothetical protein
LGACRQWHKDHFRREAEINEALRQEQARRAAAVKNMYRLRALRLSREPGINLGGMVAGVRRVTRGPKRAPSAQPFYRATLRHLTATVFAAIEFSLALTGNVRANLTRIGKDHICTVTHHYRPH